MPTAQTWFWIGTGTAAAAIVTGSVLLVRGLQATKVVETTPPKPTVPIPPLPPIIPPDLGSGGGTRVTPSALLRAEICQQWKTGNNRPRWRPELFNEVNDVLMAEIEAGDAIWLNDLERQGKAFNVARSALSQLCPGIPLPAEPVDVEQLSSEFYWDELWGRIYTTAYNMLGDYGS